MTSLFLQRLVLEAFAANGAGYSVPFVWPPEITHLPIKKRWKIVQAFKKRRWLDNDMMVRITARGLEALERLRSRTLSSLPTARLLAR